MADALNRAQFDSGCKSLIARPPVAADGGEVLRESEVWKAWMWKEHTRFSGFGYLSREVYLNSSTSDALDAADDDDSTGSDEVESLSDPAESRQRSLASGALRIRVVEHVVFSATFRVPVFYFNAFDETGSPIPITTLIHTRLLHLPLPPSSLLVARHAISLPPPATTYDTPELPLLTQGEHPTTGEACWYLHPCETAAAVREILAARDRTGAGEENEAREWLKAWFLVLGRVVDLRAGSG